MEVKFTVESTNGKTWTATCADPVLEAEGTDIIAVSKLMAAKIEKWFIETFNTTKRVVVEVPTIKAVVKASVSVRAETPLDEFPVKPTTPDINSELVQCSGCGVEILVKEGDEKLCEACAYDRSVNAKSGEIYDELTAPKRPALPMPPSMMLVPKVDGPCAYISDGKGIVPTGVCEAISDDPSDTPGLLADADGSCQGQFEKCSYYKSGATRKPVEPEDDESYDSDEIDEYGTPEDNYR